MRADISTTNLTLTWPDGTTVLDGLNLSLGPGRHGLVGLNGSGKTALLRVLAGELAPTSGTLTLSAQVGFLRQDPAPDPRARVADLLGISATLRAIVAIEAGSVDPADFDAVGQDWDIAARAHSSLAALGLPRLDLYRPAGSLSGGEVELLALSAVLLRRPGVLLLDEPTNNLDASARARVHEVVRTWPGLLLVVSHDLDLLELVEDIGELRDGRIDWYGGGFAAYQAVSTANQRAAERGLTAARAEVRRQRADLAQAQVKQARRDRAGRARAGSLPPILAGARARRAQETAGRVSGVHEQRLAAARTSFDDARERARGDREIRIDLPDTSVPPQRRVLRLTGLRPQHAHFALDLQMWGRERLAVTGRNGVGKSALVRAVVGRDAPAAGSAEVLVPFGYLPQDVSVLLDPGASVLANVRRVAPNADPHDVRARLAQFLFRGEAAERPAGTLSGGQRWRASLACLLLADPAPQLLVLDEPTNSLDLAGRRHLRAALAAYQGALLVVSHDGAFLREVGPNRMVDLDGAPGEDSSGTALAMQ